MKRIIILLSSFVFVIFLLILLPKIKLFKLNLLFQTQVHAQTSSDWYMAGANPQRTSWVSEEVSGMLRPLWYRPIEPYINGKVQLVAGNGLLYISTARGLYAFDANNGDVAWIYPTEMPLGHSPTVVNGVAYVGGYDRRIHAIDALTGVKLPSWNFHEAEAGFETNPLVVNGTVYAGNRDGYLYALDATTGNLNWRYQTAGPILFSAAYQDGVVFFASNDSYAYAVNASDGSLVWKSAKLPGAGFHSWWPVVYQDYVIFAGSNNYRSSQYGNTFNGQYNPGTFGLWDDHQVLLTNPNFEMGDLYPNYATDPHGTPIGPLGTEPGDWVSGTITIDASQITEYLENKPWRRTYFVLNRFTGEEYTFDSDNDTNPEYPPFAWTGTHSGNRYPPVIGSDGVLYQQNNFLSDQWIPGGGISGWKFGTPFISAVTSDWQAVDEPHAYAAGGNLVYWNLCCDRQAGSFDISLPNTNFPGRTGGREWDYFGYNLESLIPGYNINYYNYTEPVTYGSQNGVYGTHGTVNPPIPYQGKIYMHRSNALIAFGVTQANPVALPLVETVEVQDNLTPFSTQQLRQKLETEIQKIINAGHLRPGYSDVGIFDSNGYGYGDYLIDYFHNPADTLYTLIQALPHLSAPLQLQTRSYLQQEFTNYPPYNIAHIGWQDGVAREVFDLPPEIEVQRDQFPAKTSSKYYPWETLGWWQFPQHSFYGLWKYAEIFGDANNLFNQIVNKLEPPPTDAYLTEYPYVHNAYIAGYIGYIELGKLAGYTETSPELSSVVAERDRLLSLRATNFTKDTPFSTTHNFNRALNVSRNFIYLVPELAQYLHDHALTQVQQALDEYKQITPFWFVAKYDATYAEGVIQHLYDYHSLFQAKAQILKQPYEELVKYLDVPAFERGDLFYIDNLVSALEAPSSQEPKLGDANSDDKVNTIDFGVWLVHLNQSTPNGYLDGDFNNDTLVNLVDLFSWFNNYAL